MPDAAAPTALNVNADNHLFFRGTGKSTPTEYEPAQDVDPAVVADWLLTTAGSAGFS